VRLINPKFVKPFVKSNKNDDRDAEAICEAVTRPTMRFVPIKTAEQQAAAMVLKTRDLLVRQRNQAVNALRAHLSELGIIAGTGIGRVAELIAIVRDEDDERLPQVARLALAGLADQIEALTTRLGRLEREIVSQVRDDTDLRRLTTIPGVGSISAASIKALVPDPNGFVSGRHFAAWLGLTPRSHSSGGKERLGRISKMGNRMLRRLLILGATTILRHARNGAKVSAWMTALLARRPAKVAAIAVANKTARLIWALLVKGGVYREPDLVGDVRSA
jgi:transposase